MLLPVRYVCGHEAITETDDPDPCPECGESEISVRLSSRTDQSRLF